MNSSGSISAARPSTLVGAGALGLATFALALAGMTFTRNSGGVALVWPVNVLVLARLLRIDRRWWLPNVVCAGIGIAGASLASGNSAMVVTVLPIANLAEILICAFGLRRLCGEAVDLTRTRHLATFLGLAGVVAPAISAILAALALGFPDHGMIRTDWFSWAASDSLGMIILGPALLALTPVSLATVARKSLGLVSAGLFALLAASLAAVFLQTRVPILFLIPPILMLITIRLGLLGGAMALLVTAMASIPLSLAGYGPVSLMHGGPGDRLFFIQFFLAVLSLVVLPLAAVLDQRDRLEVALRDSAAGVRQTNLELERRVAERTAQLTAANEQLNAAMIEQSEAQRALEQREAEYRASFEVAAVGKVQFEPETGRIIRVNNAFARMLGYEPEDLIGRIGARFTTPEDRPADSVAYNSLLTGESESYVREKRHVRKDGTPIWSRSSVTMLRSDGGQPKLVIAVIEDIDERYKARLALEAANQNLEQVVEERTAALVQRDLLLREVYHRVKNNLQIVDSILVLQALQLDDPAAKSALKSLRGRIYALGLVHQQLMGSANLKTFDIAPFLRELAKNLVDGGAGRRIALSVNAMPLDVGLDFAIPLGLLVTELVTNAIKHAFPDGEGQIHVDLGPGQDKMLTLVVSDDGQGFTPLSMSLEGAKPGLGTDIVESLVAQLKGTMAMRQSKGTRIEITLPAPDVA